MSSCSEPALPRGQPAGPPTDLQSITDLLQKHVLHKPSQRNRGRTPLNISSVTWESRLSNQGFCGKKRQFVPTTTCAWTCFSLLQQPLSSAAPQKRIVIFLLLWSQQAQFCCHWGGKLEMGGRHVGRITAFEESPLIELASNFRLI